MECEMLLLYGTACMYVTCTTMLGFGVFYESKALVYASCALFVVTGAVYMSVILGQSRRRF